MTKPLDPNAACTFTRKIVSHFFDDDAAGLSYEDFLDLAEECGLVRTVAYDPRAHRGIDLLDADEGVAVVIPTFNDRDDCIALPDGLCAGSANCMHAPKP